MLRREILRRCGGLVAAPLALLAARPARATPMPAAKLRRGAFTATIAVRLPILAMVGPDRRYHRAEVVGETREGGPAPLGLGPVIAETVYHLGAARAPIGAVVILTPIEPDAYAYHWPEPCFSPLAFRHAATVLTGSPEFSVSSP